MVDSAEVCKVWRAGIERNQNTAKYGRVAQDGYWHDANGKIAKGSTKSGGGVAAAFQGAMGMLRKAQGK
jgi:hypothetical protein